MNSSAYLTANPWLLWSLGLILGYPLLVIVLSETLHRLEQRGRPLGGPVRHLRNITLPLLALMIFLQQLVGLPPHDTVVKVAYTFTLISVLFALLSFANVVFFAEANVTSWRARVPKLLLDLSRAFFVFVGLALLLAFVWQEDLKGLFAALGIGSLVIGLALQDTLGNLFSGIALLFEKPFAIGDIIRVGDREGKVVGMTWRTTRIHSGGNSILVIPNLTLGKESIVNLTPPGNHTVLVPVSFSYDDPPNLVKQIMVETAATVPGVLAEPPPAVTTTGYGDSAINYEVAFSVTHYSAHGDARNEFLSRVWYTARRHGLNIPFPIRTVYSHQVDLAAEAATKPDRVGKELAALPTLQALPEAGLRELSEGSVIRHFARDELVIREGDRNAVLCLILAGEALISTPDERGMECEVARLSRGDFIGIRQVMLGQPSATNARALSDLVLVAIPGDAANRMLDRSPRLARDLGEIEEARRKATLQAKHRVPDNLQMDEAGDTRWSEKAQR
jgi:small-conductance mechanosensitive channel